MKLLTRKNAVIAVLLSCTLPFTFNAAAQEASLEQSLSATLQVQGEKLVRDLSAELSNSIKGELQGFATRYTLAKPQELVATRLQNKLPQQKTSEE